MRRRVDASTRRHRVVTSTRRRIDVSVDGAMTEEEWRALRLKKRAAEIKTRGDVTPPRPAMTPVQTSEEFGALEPFDAAQKSFEEFKRVQEQKKNEEKENLNISARCL